MANKQIKAPLPGIFYRKPAPDEENYKHIGDAVNKGDVIGLIEVMKTFNEVHSDYSGVIKSFLLENEDAVMAGQVVAEVETQE